MALTNTYVQAISRIPDLFTKIRDGQAPEQLSHQLLKDWGFSSSNDRAFQPFLKALGFLSPDGKPTQRYHAYRDHSRSKEVMGEALREAYGDIFLIKAQPTPADRVAIEGKFKSYHNVSDNVAQLMAKTFFALLALADLNTTPKPLAKLDKKNSDEASIVPGAEPPQGGGFLTPTGLHYNIQIHLPATKDIEVYNAIFKSLKEHLIAQ
jgi:Family of unknown function (DUF5343)